MNGRGLYHVCHTVRAHMLAAPVVTYVRVEAGSVADALARAQALAGVTDPDHGEWSVARADDVRAAA